MSDSRKLRNPRKSQPRGKITGQANMSPAYSPRFPVNSFHLEAVMNATIRSLLAVALGLGLTGWTTGARAQESPVPKPTAEHERLAQDVGTWDATVKVWAQGPSADPSVSKGVEIVKLLPGGLWQLSEFHGKVGDLPFHGSSQTGYDPKKGKYV